MGKNNESLAEVLLKYAKSHHIDNCHFLNNEKDDKDLNDLENLPHLFVLACIMDRQMSSEKAWQIPLIVGDYLGGRTFDKFAKATEEEIKNIFTSKKIHRFYKKQFPIFYQAIQTIKNKYESDASKIWAKDSSCAEVMNRFLDFEGVGIKIAAMAVNILIRKYKIELKDKVFTSIAPDTHVRRIFKRLGCFEKIDNINSNKFGLQIINYTRVLNPEYPGEIDSYLWNLGRDVCLSDKPKCYQCELESVCQHDKKEYEGAKG